MANPVGRPTVMTQEIRDAICKRLAAGESLRSVCAEDGMPVISTVLLAVVQDRDGFSEQYMQARAAGGFSHADRIVDTVDRVSMGELDPQAARAMLDGLKWAAERMAPKHHSAKQDINHTSSDGSMTPARQPSEMTDEELAAIISKRGKKTDIG